jgi:hypothetical protein
MSIVSGPVRSGEAGSGAAGSVNTLYNAVTEGIKIFYSKGLIFKMSMLSLLTGYEDD